MEKFALEIRNLKKIFGKKIALDGVDLKIKKGEFLALLGPNGAGKSTMINIIAGILEKSGGKVFVLGKNFDADPQSAKMKMGIMPQEITLDAFFSVEEVLKIHAGLFGQKDDPAYRKFLLKKVDLWDHRDKNTRRLSGGMKRRLMIAKALVHRPKILILDEPTAGVDVELRQNLWNFVRELHASGMTILLTTHYLEEAETLAERIAILNFGKILEIDTPKNLLKNFGNRRVEIFLKKSAKISPPPFLEKTDENILAGDFSEKKLPTFLKWAAENADKIADIKIREARLEEVFLKFTKK